MHILLDESTCILAHPQCTHLHLHIAHPPQCTHPCNGHTHVYLHVQRTPSTYTYPFTGLVPRPLPDFISQLWRKSGSGLRMLLPFVMLTTPQCTHTHTNPFLPPSPSPPSLLYIPRLCILQHWPSIALFPGHYQILFRCRSKRSGCKIKKIWGGQGTCKST